MMTKQVDALEFQKRFKRLLEKKLKQAKKHIKEEDTSKYFVDDEENTDEGESSDASDQTENPDLDEEDEEDESDEDGKTEEHNTILEIESKALEFGADVVAYQYGVLQIEFNEKEESEKFAPFIEEYEKIESFEFVAHSEDYTEVEEDSEDIAFYTYWIYLKPEVVSFDYYDELYAQDDDDEEDDIEDEQEDESSEPESTETTEEPDEEPDEDEEDDETKLKQESYISEVTRRVRVNYRGIKKIKMTCGPGYKYNHKTMACEKIQGKALAVMRVGIRKALASKRQGGAALKNRTAARARRAQHYRKAFGL
jgi:hypothetical protein